MKTPIRLEVAGSQLNQVSDRAAMGLPERFAEHRPLAVASAIEELRLLPKGHLVVCVESPSEPLYRRLAAGQLLALLGDPRLSTRHPAMIPIPGGRVRMGLPFEKVDEVVRELASTGVQADWIEKECPRHEVTLAPYRIGKFPVTNQEYREFLKATGYPEIPTSWEFGRYPEERANHPVYTVSVAAAESYAAWLARETGRPFRLPTESEWELAAAGPQGREYPWGNRFHAGFANTVESGLLSTSPVGAFPAGNSPFGVADLAGNVEEYVADDYAPYPGGKPVADDLVNALQTYRIARGGSFTRFRDLARCRRRHGRYPREIYVMGFRLAEGVESWS